MKRILALLILLAGSLCAQQTSFVIVVVIDGVRYTESFGDPTHQWIPRIWTDLRPQGVIYTAYSNDGLTETNPGHASIATGAWQTITNDGLERPHTPTLFEYHRKGLGSGTAEHFVVLGKTKLNILAFSDHPEYGSTFGASVAGTPSQYNDQLAADTLKRVLRTNHPHLVILNLPNSDNVAHSGNWAGYLSSVRNADSLTYEIWNTVQNDSVMKGKTTMFVTNDHGRHTTSFSGHGDGCDGCRHLMLLVIGPDTPSGVTDALPRKQIDIVPTIGALLGFPTPYATGNVIGSAIATGVEPLASGTPGEFHLRQNFPNPFNPTTTIGYGLPRRSQVLLTVFSVLGQQIVVLEDADREAGYHEVMFDATGLSSGVYFYRLQSGSFAETKKLLLMR